MKTQFLLVCILFTNIISAQWTRINNSPSIGERIYFYNAQTGYVIKSNELYKTTDGGTTWNNIPTGLATSSVIENIYFTSQDSGFIFIKEFTSFAYPVRVYTTINGGTTWNSVLGPFDSGDIDFHIAGANDWYFHVTTYFTTSDTIYHTTNAGNTWIKTGNATTVQYNLVINNLIVYKDSISPSSDKLFYRSTNGGSTWNLLLTDNTVSAGFMDYQFVNNNDGYVLLFQYNASDAIDSKIYKTIDGGQNWVGYSLPSTCSGPQSMHFTDVNTGYIISNDSPQQKSEIFKTVNGGQTWTLVFSANTNEYFSEVYDSPLERTGIWEYFGKLYVLGNNVIVNDISTFVKDLKTDKTNFVLFPNPSKGQLTIESELLKKDEGFVIIDISGKEMYKVKGEHNFSQTIDVTFLVAGLYLLKNTETNQSVLFVKE